MKRLIEYTVFSGLVTAWRLATWPTSRSAFLVMATTEGVVRAPSWLGMTTGSPPCMTATTEFVVPKSIPIILLIALVPLLFQAQNLLCGTDPRRSFLEGQLNAGLLRCPFDARASIKVECMFVKIVDMHCKYMILRWLEGRGRAR